MIDINFTNFTEPRRDGLRAVPREEMEAIVSAIADAIDAHRISVRQAEQRCRMTPYAFDPLLVLARDLLADALARVPVDAPRVELHLSAVYGPMVRPEGSR